MTMPSNADLGARADEWRWGYLHGYLHGWGDHKAGRQYGEGRYLRRPCEHEYTPNMNGTYSWCQKCDSVIPLPPQRRIAAMTYIPAGWLEQQDRTYKPVGILIDGREFIPLDIVNRHLPFAVPPGQDVQTVYVLDRGDYAPPPNDGSEGRP